MDRNQRNEKRKTSLVETSHALSQRGNFNVPWFKLKEYSNQSV